MKVLLLSMNFSPELTGIGKYSGEMARGLVERGHEVQAVCAPPYYPQWSVQAGYRAGGYLTETPQPGLTVHRCPLWIPRRLSGLRRLVHLASFALSSLPRLLSLVRWRPDVVYVVAPALFCAPAGWLVARLSGAVAWLHIQDLEVDAAFELGLLKGSWARAITLAGERWLMRSFDMVSTISSRMLRQLATKGLPLDRTELLPNWVDMQLIHPTGGSPALRERLNIAPDQLVCLFSGTINRKQGLDVVIQAARRLRSQLQIVFVICGNGELRAKLEQDSTDLANMRFIDLQPQSALNDLLNMADLHLLPQLRGAADLVMPSKLAGMLASGRPVVAAALRGTEIASVVAGRGLIVEPESVDGFVQAIQTLYEDAPLRKHLGQQARAYAERTLDAARLFDRLSLQLAQADERRRGVDAGPGFEPRGHLEARAQAMASVRRSPTMRTTDGSD